MRLSALFALLGLLAAPAVFDPVITYEGTLVVQDLEDGTTTETYGVVATVDCSTGPCIARLPVTDGSQTIELLGPDGVMLLDGAASTTMAASGGGPCDDDYIPSAAVSVTVTATTFSLTSDYAGSGVVDCPDGTSVEYIPYHATLDAAYLSGDVCALSSSCETATPTATAVPVALGPGPVLDSGPAAPGTLSTLPTVADAASPGNAAWAAGLTVVLVILIALPTRLLNVAIETGSDRATTWLRRQRPDSPAPRPRTAWLLAGGGVLVAAVISSFVDPRFGLDASSPRVFLSVLTSFLLDVVLGWIVVILIARRTTPGARPSIRFVPATLLIVAAAVVFSRLTGFEPGLVFGLVAGVVFGAGLAASDRARVELLPLGVAFVAAVLGWIGYSLLGSAEGVIAVFARETFSAMAIGGLAALPIALVPLRGLPGEAVFAWNRWVWGAAYAVGLFGFFFVLMPLPIAWDAVDLSIWVWVGIYVAYALLAVMAWFAATRFTRRASARDGTP